MRHRSREAMRTWLSGAAATLAGLAVVVCASGQLACILPPTMPALRHTGRLAPPSSSGLFRLGMTTDFDAIAGPDLGWRFRLEEHVELDMAGYAMFAFGEEYPNVAAMGRVGIGVGLLEREHGALALLAGVGVGGLYTEWDSDGPDGMPVHHVDELPLLGGDVGIAGSLRYFGWFEPYLGFRFSAVAELGDDDVGTFIWLMPALGVRFLANPSFALSIEWTNGIYFFAEADAEVDWITGASLALELGPNGS